MRNNLDIIILTYNEEVNIQKCLESAKNLSNNIHVVDSYSTDNTLDICSKYDVQIHKNEFINQGIQFNWALDNLKLNNDWILRLDADETVSEKLNKSILYEVSKKNNLYDGFYINRKLIWCEKWIKYGGIYPHWISRLFKKNRARYEERTEEHLIIKGKTKKLKGDLIEDNKKNLISFFTIKHLETAKGETKEFFDNKYNTLNQSESLNTKNNIRRYAKLNLYNRLPIFLRAFLYFVLRYFFQLGFLDGKHGFTFHFFQGFWYRMLIDLMIYEKKNN
tara:strand:+ start:1139 stop:1969 length:831 start_codon:yes stop_codon:yes gene_type:complete